jgi:hypothetical protein
LDGVSLDYGNLYALLLGVGADLPLTVNDATVLFDANETGFQVYKKLLSYFVYIINIR